MSNNLSADDGNPFSIAGEALQGTEIDACTGLTVPIVIPTDTCNISEASPLTEETRPNQTTPLSKDESSFLHPNEFPQQPRLPPSYQQAQQLAQINALAPKQVLHSFFGQSPRKTVLPKSSFFTWNDGGASHLMRWT